MRSASILLAIIVCCCLNEEIFAQQCQGCVCSNGPSVYPAYTIQECIQGCSIIEIVCSGDGGVTRRQFGLAFAGKPKSVPKDCTIEIIPNGGTLTGHPASGCPTGRPQVSPGGGCMGPNGRGPNRC